MAGKTTFTPEQKTRVFVVLSANDGNVKRTVRETGVAESTVRNWKRKWEKEPPSQELVAAEVEAPGGYVSDLEQARNEALAALRNKIPSMSGQQLAVAYGILEDKLTRARGLASERTEVVHKLPSADELALAGEMLATGAIEAARKRQQELVESAVREQPALMPGL